MTYKEFAHNLAENIKKQPTESNIRNAVISILNAKDSNGVLLSEASKRTIIDYLIEEVGNFSPIMESYDNKEAMTMAQMINNMIAQANVRKE